MRAKAHESHSIPEDLCQWWQVWTSSPLEATTLHRPRRREERCKWYNITRSWTAVWGMMITLFDSFKLYFTYFVLKNIYVFRFFSNRFDFALFFSPNWFFFSVSHFPRKNWIWPMRAKAHESHSIPEDLCQWWQVWTSSPLEATTLHRPRRREERCKWYNITRSWTAVWGMQTGRMTKNSRKTSRSTWRKICEEQRY